MKKFLSAFSAPNEMRSLTGSRLILVCCVFLLDGRKVCLLVWTWSPRIGFLLTRLRRGLRPLEFVECKSGASILYSIIVRRRARRRSALCIYVGGAKNVAAFSNKNYLLKAACNILVLKPFKRIMSLGTAARRRTVHPRWISI